MFEIVFWSAGILSIYSYFLYPLLLIFLVRIWGYEKDFCYSDSFVKPSISLIITAHNEASRIREKLENSLEIQYCAELDIIVASDQSTDATDQIVGEYVGRGVRLVRSDRRQGKEYAQLCALKQASGEVIVFSDVATKIPIDALSKMAIHFSDHSVGAVSSEDCFISQDGRIVGEGAYVKYEMLLRRMESKLSGLVGLSGSFFAARKSVCRDWDIQSPSDFNTAFNCVKANMKAISVSGVVGIYKDLKSSKGEYQRKVRTVLRGMTALSRNPGALNPFRYGLFSFQVWSHKVMRWLAPWFLILTFICNIALYSDHALYQVLMYAQIAFYGTALGAKLIPGLQNIGAIKIIYYFVQVNVAICESFLRLLLGQRMTVWKPSAR